MEQARKRTTSRRELARNPRFEQISPDVGELDEAAVDEAMADDPDDVLAMLADLTGATDPRLRELAKRIAGRLYLDIARRGPTKPRGTGRLAELPYRPDRGDLDLDASLDVIAAARAAGEAVDPDRLRVRAWSTPATAICLLVDRSGSMEGRPLATSAVAAAAVSWRAPSDYSVLSFGKDVIAAKSQDRTAVRSNRSSTPCSRSAASGRPTSRERCVRRANSWRGRRPVAASPCCCRIAGPPSPVTWSVRRRRSTSS